MFSEQILTLPWLYGIIEDESAVGWEICINECKLLASFGKGNVSCSKHTFFGAGDLVEYQIKELSDITCAVNRFLSMTWEIENKEELGGSRRMLELIHSSVSLHLNTSE